jgi:hypothetical protein
MLLRRKVRRGRVRRANDVAVGSSALHFWKGVFCLDSHVESSRSVFLHLLIRFFGG